ncbi:MAG: dihydroorotase [Syntrophomonadaceae bacterium]|nr:dihydroorotase [Syntrophomonadaceae bacterium]MDD3889327.1 dihydroorotase [Syntrophomonadaceae bacterium]MDD4550253.1 dihydroorotase [Syntrophomonadaceae bacterium]
MKLLIRGGKVVDPANGINDGRDVAIIDGKLAGLNGISDLSDFQVIDATGKIVCPGFIDMHVHLREPGFEYKEDIVTGTRAAAAGGITTVCCMPNTEPVIDNAAVASFVVDRARKAGLVNVLPIGAITKKQEGNELSEIGELVSAGCVAVSDDGKPVMKADIMRNALDYTKMFGLPVLSHCEDLALAADGQMHEGYYSTIYGLKGIPTAAEEVMAARDIILARLTGGHVHICHISTRGSVELIRQAKKDGIKVTCEATPHHLTLTDELVGSYDADTKVNPPLRSTEHVEALLEGLNDGTIDCIVTDHAPHHLESKDCEYNLAAFGISGLETSVAVCMNLVNQGKLSLEKMVSLYTTGPANVLGIDKGTLTPGMAADVTIIDPEKVKIVDPAEFYSRGKNSAFKGMKLKGWPVTTIVAGNVVTENGRIVTP